MKQNKKVIGKYDFRGEDEDRFKEIHSLKGEEIIERYVLLNLMIGNNF